MSENPDTSLAAAPLTPGFHKATSALATTLGIEPRMMVETLKKQCFPNQNSDNISDAQLASFISVAITLKLNPLVPGMLYAYPGKNGAMVPVTGPDGVFKMLDERIASGSLDGYECVVYPEDMTQKPTHAMATIWRKGSDHPSKYTAMFSEWVVGSNPNWGSRPRHMLWIRALKQCARQVIHGIPFDEDEVVIGDLKDVTPEGGKIERAPVKERAKKGASTVKDTAPTATRTTAPEVVVTEAEQAAAQPPAEPAKTAAPKPEQRALLADGEVITVEAMVEEFKVVVGKREGKDFPYVKAVIVSPELRGNVSHVEGSLLDGKPIPAWQLDRPVRLTVRGKKYANGSTANVVDSIVEAVPETAPAADEV